MRMLAFLLFTMGLSLAVNASPDGNVLQKKCMTLLNSSTKSVVETFRHKDNDGVYKKINTHYIDAGDNYFLLSKGERHELNEIHFYTKKTNRLVSSIKFEQPLFKTGLEVEANNGEFNFNVKTGVVLIHGFQRPSKLLTEQRFILTKWNTKTGKEERLIDVYEPINDLDKTILDDVYDGELSFQSVVSKPSSDHPYIIRSETFSEEGITLFYRTIFYNYETKESFIKDYLDVSHSMPSRISLADGEAFFPLDNNFGIIAASLETIDGLISGKNEDFFLGDLTREYNAVIDRVTNFEFIQDNTELLIQRGNSVDTWDYKANEVTFSDVIPIQNTSKFVKELDLLVETGPSIFRIWDARSKNNILSINSGEGFTYKGNKLYFARRTSEGLHQVYRALIVNKEVFGSQSRVVDLEKPPILEVKAKDNLEEILELTIDRQQYLVMFYKKAANLIYNHGMGSFSPPELTDFNLEVFDLSSEKKVISIDLKKGGRAPCPFRNVTCKGVDRDTGTLIYYTNIGQIVFDLKSYIRTRLNL